ncbi:MAG: aminoglycoside phosphotransferase family protein [Ilumatobacteraceae bacterium]
MSLRNYENEVRFYQELALRPGDRTPAVYYADIQAGDRRLHPPARGHGAGPPGRPTSRAATEAAQLAIDEETGKLHAPVERPLDRTRMARQEPRESRQNMSILLPLLWAGYRKALRRRHQRRRPGCQGPRCSSGWTTISLPDPVLTVVHGDYRLDNLLFGPPGSATPLAVVDWQTVSYGSPMNDVAYFLGAGLQIEDRREHRPAWCGATTIGWSSEASPTTTGTTAGSITDAARGRVW